MRTTWPVHVTLKVREDLPSLRSGPCFDAIYRSFLASRERFGLRLIDFVVMGNHIHLVVETHGRTSLTRGLKGLQVRIARRLNMVLGRKGAVFADRYHEHILKTPAEVRNALHYVRHNLHHHGGDYLDHRSSMFDGPHLADSALVSAKTWLLTSGLQRQPFALKSRRQLCPKPWLWSCE